MSTVGLYYYYYYYFKTADCNAYSYRAVQPYEIVLYIFDKGFSVSLLAIVEVFTQHSTAQSTTCNHVHHLISLNIH